MYLFFILIPIWALFGTLMYFYRNAPKEQRDDMTPSQGFFTAAGVITCIVLIIFGISTATYINDNVIDIANYRQIDNIIQQREDLMNKNLPEIKKILVETYPQYEKDIFEVISMRDVEWLWMRYPEIKSLYAMQSYVNNLNSYTMWYQEQREKQLQYAAAIESRKNTPWALTWFVPTVNTRVVLESE